MAKWSDQDCREVILLYHKYSEKEGLDIPSYDIKEVAKKIGKAEGSVKMKLSNHRYLVTGKEDRSLTNFSRQHKLIYDKMLSMGEINCK